MEFAVINGCHSDRLLVKAIRQQGHEVGCHSYLHRKVYDLTPQQFRDDTQQAKAILEGILGEPCLGYRAPSYIHHQ